LITSPVDRRSQTDDNLVKQFGIDLAIAMVERLVGEGEVEGVHFCTLNLERSVRRVLEGLTWLAKEPTAAAAGSNGPDGPSSRTHGGAPLEEMKNMFIQQEGRSFLPSAPAAAFTISSAAASLAAAAGLHHTHHAEVSQPTAPAGDASWDEFPNGRFTDVRSPAYGELDGYGGGLKILVRQRKPPFR
jgi:methylenetetrahydrofolate reductase (NADPH)